ncbi:MAG: hypothetical protein JKY17_05635 [Magnetovibrio sp.]|nr:hypothetical protein [Magnetovibrio sp.]
MMNHIKWALVATVLSTMVLANAANAIPISRCLRLISNLHVGRDTILNTCKVCITATVERKRPSGTPGPPTLREFNLNPNTQLALPFKGPGQTRITGELKCPSARP